MAATFLSTVAGWVYTCTRGKKSALVSSGLMVGVYGTLYVIAPARKFPTSEEVTEGVDLKGKVAVVTGATSGIGIETVRVLAERGAHVYLAARNELKLEVTMESLKSNNPDLKLDILVCDLSDLDSVKACAATFLKQNDSLDLLINNAGIMAVQTREETKQGLESQVGVCHVGHFYLTKLLLSAIQKAKASRVVCLSSSAHAYHQFDRCLNTEKLETDPYDPWVAYGNAKVANLLHAKALTAKGVDAYSVMPGGIMTGLQSNVTWWTYIKFSILSPLFFKNVNQGAATSLLCATSAEVPEQGEYHDNCKPSTKALATVLEKVGSDAPIKLWNVTEALLQTLGYN